MRFFATLVLFIGLLQPSSYAQGTTQITYTGAQFVDCHPLYQPYVQCLSGRVSATLIFDGNLPGNFTGKATPTSVVFNSGIVTLQWPTSDESTVVIPHDGFEFVNGVIVKYYYEIRDTHFLGYHITISTYLQPAFDSIEATRLFATPSPHYEPGIAGYSISRGAFKFGAAPPVGTCSDLLTGGIQDPTFPSGLVPYPFNSGRFSGSFTPRMGKTLDEAATMCGFVGFNWVQYVVHLPDPSPFCVANSDNPAAPDPSPFCQLEGTRPSRYNRVHLTSSSVPFHDPPKNGYTYGWYDSYPFYYPESTLDAQCAEPYNVPANDANCGLRAINSGRTTLSIVDVPSDICLASLNPFSPYYRFFTLACGIPDFPPPLSEHVGFETHLAGVLPDGSPFDLGMGYRWQSNAYSTSGNMLASDGNALTGGTSTLLAVMNTTNYIFPRPTGAPVARSRLLDGTEVNVISSGLSYSRAVGEFIGTVSVRNIGTAAISGPLRLVLSGLDRRIMLANNEGMFGDSPYLTLAMGSDLLMPGQTVVAVVRFKNPLSISYKLNGLVYVGSFN